MTILAKGANVPVPAARVRATLSWSPGPGVPDIDGSALVLRAGGRVASDADFVFYNQPVHPGGAVRHTGKHGGTDVVEVALDGLGDDIERVVFAASADGGVFGQVPGLILVLTDADTGTGLAEFAIRAATETAMVSGELYRREGRWKFRAVGQGYASGLAGLASDFGISVADDTPATAPPVPVSNGPTAAPLLTLDDGPVSLVKGARVNLVKGGAPSLRRVTMGLGWDPARKRKPVDLDASAIAFDAAGIPLATAWFTKLTQFGGALHHEGDNLTGDGDGDDERIRVDLAGLPPEVASVIFTITSFRKHTFTEVANAYCRLVDDASGAELVRYDLSDAQASTGAIMAGLRRTGPQTWQMRAIGEFHDGRTVMDLLEPATRWATAP